MLSKINTAVTTQIKDDVVLYLELFEEHELY